jgi:hypothetical protein
VLENKEALPDGLDAQISEMIFGDQGEHIPGDCVGKKQASDCCITRGFQIVRNISGAPGQMGEHCHLLKEQFGTEI